MSHNASEVQTRVGKAGQKHRIIASDGRRYGVGVADRLTEYYGSRVDMAEADEAAASAKREIFCRVRELWSEGMPADLALVWGHEAINGLCDNLPEHLSYLRVAARLAAVDPNAALSDRDHRRR